MAGTLKGRHGVILWSAQTALGTVVTPATAAGAGGFDATLDAGIVPVNTLGQYQPMELKPGQNVTRARFSIEALQDEHVLLNCVRTLGQLPYMTWGFGYQQDGPTPPKFAWQVQDCKVNSFDLEATAPGLVRASLDIIGGLETDLTTLVPAQLAQSTYYTYEAVLQKAAGAYPVDVRSFRLTVNHNISIDSVLPSVAPITFKRGWKYLTEGQQTVTGQVVAYAKSGVNMFADTEAGFNLVLTLTDIAAGTNTVVITLTGCKYNSEQMAAPVGGDLMFTTPFTALDVAITGT